MYVDESGDSGMVNSPTRYFALTGLVVHELRWRESLNSLIAFRQRMKGAFGLKLREEIHAAAFINAPGDVVRIKRNNRLTVLRMFADELGAMRDLNLINVIVDKQGKSVGYDVFGVAWKALLQRFENTILYRNFPGPSNPDERGMVMPDFTDNKKLTQLVRQMRRFNPVPNAVVRGPGYRNLMLVRLIEDPSFRDSKDSYFVQACDLAAWLLYQSVQPSAYMRKNSGQNYWKRLHPILCLKASPRDPDGVVRI